MGGKVFYFVLLLSFFVSGLAQQRTITGTIHDKKGDPVAFANVLVDNTNIGTISDVTGKFKLTVGADCKRLHIKYIGYDDAYVDIPSDGKPIKVRMKEAVFQLKDVVVKPGIN
ncbi:MAG: carboxypeptidase-like regulatory domain-containing protein, partial [Bacteroidales bacterium]|nr:carboxypeptidase-like regulatory domain-containing protein [Bacteroidales bacterium]